jgi:hypothetical protein
MQIDVIAMDNLHAYSLLLVIFVGLSIVLATSEIGWQLGVRALSHLGRAVQLLTSEDVALRHGRFAAPLALTKRAGGFLFNDRRVRREGETEGIIGSRARPRSRSISPSAAFPDGTKLIMIRFVPVIAAPLYFAEYG